MTRLSVIEGWSPPDNYAWYATAAWFTQWHGIAPPATSTLEQGWVDGHFEDDSDTGYDNEGYIGYTISQIVEYNSAYKQRLNVARLHAATNDMGQATGSDTAPERLDSIVGTLVAALPDATTIFYPQSSVKFPPESVS
ncbi:SGNH hydrolase [Fusarium mundagurra]|uniref:SGNH hydrolase n=1 Tax=Fusarium mundagurra TaxID=1567541 RepID=A0A8H5XVS6_9HYPO|nr:SGNH hydrolase [Fusarium mundagurra]